MAGNRKDDDSDWAKRIIAAGEFAERHLTDDERGILKQYRAAKSAIDERERAKTRAHYFKGLGPPPVGELKRKYERIDQEAYDAVDGSREVLKKWSHHFRHYTGSGSSIMDTDESEN